MIVELFHSRGLGIYVDGESPDHGNWSIGENEETGGYDISDRPGNPLKVGPLEIIGIEYDVTMQDFEEGADPTKLYVITPTERLAFKVTSIVNGSVIDSVDEVDELPKITLANGDTRELDDITAYVKAEN